MNRLTVRVFLGVLLLTSLLLIGVSVSRAARPDSPVLAEFNARLEPGVLHQWVLRPSETLGAYLVEVSPLQKPGPDDGNYVQSALVRPEFDGELWNDVLRVQLPVGSDNLKVHIRVYETSRLPLLIEFDTILQPNTWHGYVLGSAAADQGYVVEVTPLRAGAPGDYIARVHVQPERSPGGWNDVLRIQAACQADLPVHVRVYATASLPVLTDFNIALVPGMWQGYLVQPAKAGAAYVVEVTPDGASDAVVDRALVQPEFDGKAWNDVVRLVTLAGGGHPPLPVNVRVYALQARP